MSNMDKEASNERIYFQLLERVGAYGPYQVRSLLILCAISMLGASSFFINPFIFYQGTYHCPTTVNNCETFVCALPPGQRHQYLTYQFNIQTLGTAFGDLHCENMGSLTAMQTAMISGSFVGIIIGLFMTQQFGRKMTTVYTLGLTIVGILVIMISGGTGMACVGLFLFGTGAEISYTLVFTIVTEIVDEQHRSKYYVYLLLFFGFGAMGNAIVFYLLGHYEWVLLVYYLLPNGVALYAFNRYVQDTPIQLVSRHSPRQALDSLLFIAQENSISTHGLSLQEIAALQQEYKQNQLSKQHGDKFTIIDLFRFESVRVDLLKLSLHFFIVMFQLYAPMLLSSYLNMNIFSDGLINGAAQLATVPVLLAVTTTLPRRKGQVLFMSLTFCFSAMLAFLSPQTCNNCYHGGYGMLLVIFFFLYRFSANITSNFFATTLQQTFSAQLRPLGVFFVIAVGRSSSLSIPYLYHLRNQYDITLMTLFTVGALLGIFSGSFLRQTVGIAPCEFIKELQLKEHHQYHRLKDKL